MSNDRLRTNTPRVPIPSDQQQGRSADRQLQLPAWNREQLIQQFQGIDGSTRSDAERQIDAYERSFCAIFGGSLATGTSKRHAEE